MVHLSVRLAWNDIGWNGCICKNPHLNASCIGNETIRDERDDDREREFAETHLSKLDGWKPPCSRDILTYSPEGMQFTHSDPLHRRFLKPVQEEIPPYTTLPAPYRWLREETFRDICEAENLSIRMGDKAEKTIGWVYEPDRQLALLNHYWGKIKEGEGQALIFFIRKKIRSMRILRG